MVQNIRSNFLNDQNALKKDVFTYLNGPAESIIDVATHRTLAQENVRNGNWIEAIRNLENAHDAKKGIVAVKRKPLDGATPVLIRDARNCHDTPIAEGIEAAEMTILANFEAAKDVLDFEGKGSHAKLHQMAVHFFDDFFHTNTEKSSEELFALSRLHLSKIADFLTDCGISVSQKKINQALHFQNFKQDANYNPVTLSSITDDEGSKHTIIESNVAFKGLTDTQKSLYDTIASTNSVSPLQKNLMKKYRPQIFSGNFVIPAQLINCVPGIRNAFEESTSLIKNSAHLPSVNEQDIQLIDVRKRSGALPTLLKDEALTAKVSQANANQASLLMKEPKATLHWNSLNTDVPVLGPMFGGKTETQIAKNSQQASKNEGVRFSSTPVNKFRKIGVTEVSDMKRYLNDFADAIKSDSKEQIAIKEFLKPPSFLGRLKRIFAPLPSVDQAIDTLKKQKDANLLDVVELAVDLKKGLKESASIFNVRASADKENNNLHNSTTFGRLTHIVNNGTENKTSGLSSFCHTSKMPHIETVHSCKSGKDRTGLNMIYRMIKVLHKEIDVSFDDISNRLHLSGHIENLPGSLLVGGGTPGCYQLQAPVLHAIPESKKSSLQHVVGAFSHNNKATKKTDRKLGKPQAMDSKDILPLEDKASSQLSEDEKIGAGLHNPSAQPLKLERSAVR